MQDIALDRSGLRMVSLARAAKSVLVASLALAAAKGHGQAAAHRLAALGASGPATWQDGLQSLATLVTAHHALLVGLLAALAALHAAEAWGLWMGRRWASWLVVVGASVLLPLEAAAAWKSPDLLRLSVLAANAAVVAWLAWGLRRDVVPVPVVAAT